MDIQRIKDKLRVYHKHQAGKQIMQMNIFSDLEGYLYYGELLFNLYKLKQLKDTNEDPTSEGFKIIQKEELKNFNYITERRRKEMKQNKKEAVNMKETINPIV